MEQFGYGYTHNPDVTYLDDEDYFRFVDSRKLVHRWAAEKKLGRKLLYSERIHHIDHNKRNNKKENLFVCKDQLEHEKIHHLDEKYGIGEGIKRLSSPKKVMSVRQGLILGFVAIIATLIYLRLISLL